MLPKEIIKPAEGLTHVIGVIDERREGTGMSVLEDIRRVFEKCEALMARDAVRKSSAYFAILSTPPCPTCKHKPEYREGPPETIVMCDHFIAELKRKCPEQVTSNSMGEFTLGIDWCGFVVERADA